MAGIGTCQGPYPVLRLVALRVVGPPTNLELRIHTVAGERSEGGHFLHEIGTRTALLLGHAAALGRQSGDPRLRALGPDGGRPVMREEALDTGGGHALEATRVDRAAVLILPHAHARVLGRTPPTRGLLVVEVGACHTAEGGAVTAGMISGTVGRDHQGLLKWILEQRLTC